MLLEGNSWMLEEAWRMVLHDHDDWSLIGDRSMEEVGNSTCETTGFLQNLVAQT